MAEVVYMALLMLFPGVVAIVAALTVSEWSDRLYPRLSHPPAGGYPACPHCRYSLEGHEPIMQARETERRDRLRTAARREIEAASSAAGHPVDVAADRPASAASAESSPGVRSGPFAARDEPLAAVVRSPAMHGVCPECGLGFGAPIIIPPGAMRHRGLVLWLCRLTLALFPISLLPPWLVYHLSVAGLQRLPAPLASGSLTAVIGSTIMITAVLCITVMVAQSLALIRLSAAVDWRTVRETAGGWVGVSIALNTAAMWIASVISSAVMLTR